MKVTGITWKGVETIISIKIITCTIPQSIEFLNRTIADSTAMSNVLNNYFTSINEKAKQNNFKIFAQTLNYLSITNTNTFFLIQTDKTETSFTISSLNPK